MPLTYSVMSLVSAETFAAADGEIAVLAQHESVVLDHGAATRCRHQDGIEAASLGFGKPGRDIGAGTAQGIAILPEVMG